MDYHIYHLFPGLLNLYGDRGNILTLSFFAKQLGLNPIVHEIDDVAEIDWKHVDFMLLGGGSDREQALVTSHLQKIKDRLQKEIEKGLPMLAVCGGYQFLGDYYQDTNGNKLEGLGLLDMRTVAQKKERMIGNAMIESETFGRIFGFENHAGETFHKHKPLGKVINGYGNNLKGKYEGVMYYNLIGTYLHGPLLPKNPHLTLFFIEKFMEKHKLKFDPSDLDLSLETQAMAELELKTMKSKK